MAERTIETNLKLTGEKEFNQQMKALNNGLKTTKSDMAALSAEFDDNANSAKALTSKNKLLEKSVSQHKEKVEVLRAQYEAAVATLGEDAATTQKYKQQLNQATIALEKETDALEENQKALRKRYLAGLEMLGSGSKKALAGLGKLAGATATGTLKVAGAAAKGLGTIAAASVTGVAALGTAGVAIMTKMASFAKEAADAAKAAKEAGEPLTDDQKKWLAFSEQLDAVDASVQTAKTALGNVLLPVLSDLAGKGTKFLERFAQDMEMAGDDTKTQGRVIAKYITQLVRDIAAEIPELADFGKELIGSLGKGLSRSAPEIIEITTDLLADLLSFLLDAAPDFALAAVELINRLAEKLTDQGAELSEAAITLITLLARSIADLAPELAELAIELVEELVGGLTEDGGPELIQAAVDMVTTIVLGLAKAAPDLIPAAVNLVGQLLIALVAAAPDLILAGLELVYGVIQGIFNSFDDIKNAVEQLIEKAKEAFGDKGDEFKEIGSKILTLLKEGITEGWQAFTKWFNNLWDSLFGNRSVSVDVTGDGSTPPPPEDGSAFGGLNYVPFDDYMARLHKGEMVLTRSEADAYRQGRGNGGQKTVNLYFTATTITEADVNMVVDIVNRKLGEAM